MYHEFARRHRETEAHVAPISNRNFLHLNRDKKFSFFVCLRYKIKRGENSHACVTQIKFASSSK